MKIRVFCIQTNSSQFPSKNIEMLDKIFKKIKATKINLICLPECVAIFSDETVEEVSKISAKKLIYVSQYKIFEKEFFKNKSYNLIFF